MNPILLARHVQEGLRELVRTTLNTSSRAFDGVVDRFLADPANFIKGPWVSVDMPFRQIDGAADGTWIQPFPEIPLRFAPYQHQMDAFARLSGTAMRSTLVATGTGSGKTESYLWPILEHCRRNKGKSGIKAILIYPMNALATDQARRIASALTSIPSLYGVRAGIYADAEPQNATHEVTADSIITHRETMRRNPPDILLTNYKMLDYLLLRGRDRPLWEKNDPKTLQFLVVDELHTFDGAQGADLALLLRRLKYRLGTPERHLICVGSSATLGSGDDAATELRRYAETIFGEPFDTGAVVRETRKTPNEVFRDPEYLDRPAPAAIRAALKDAEDLDQPGAALRLAACLFPDTADPDLTFLREGDPADQTWRIALGDRLLQHHLCQRTLRLIAEQSAPASLDAIATGLSQVKVLRDWAPADHRALAELVVALVAWARSGSPENPRPLFNVRLQLWVREMSRMVTSLPRIEAGGRRSVIHLLHALDLDRHALRGVLPVVNCNRCGATAHIGRLNGGSRSLWAPLDQLHEEFFDENGGDRIRLLYHDSIDRKVNASEGAGQIVKGLLNSESMEFHPSEHDGLEPGPDSPVWMYNPSDAQGRIDRTCPACGQARGLLLFGMRAARLTTGVIGTLYTSEQNEERIAAKPRFLMFSDSIQDAAHRAAIAETRNALAVYQKSLFAALTSAETNGLSLREVIEDVPARHLDALGPDDFTALFISKEQTWRGRYQNLIRDGVSISDPVFLEQMRIRLGWEYFVDLSYRAHFSHTLEVNGIAVADIPSSQTRASAEKLAQQLRNQFPRLPEIDPFTLARFLSGVMQRMRRQGSVAHPYIASAVATSKGGRGLNWFAAAAQLGLGKTGTLPSPNPRNALAPIPITLQNSPVGFERITRSQISNWYRDWLFRTLGPVDLRLGTDPDSVYPMVLSRLEADAFVTRVNGPDGQDRHAWLLEPTQVTVSTATLGLVCDQCGRRETVLAENADHAIGSPCTRIGCEGRLESSVLPPRPALRRSLLSDRNHRVVAREHTGILEAGDRLRVETGFIKEEARWAPNLISATPTLEMGIDIGDLSTLLLSSVPPEEANYVQRMGRSGRRDGNALNMVLANARPHDLEFWEDPTPMLSGQVRPPGVFLAAEEVLLRQVTAFTLDAYVAATAEAGDYGKVREVLKRRADGVMQGFPVEWLELVGKRGTELASTFLSGLPQEVRERADLAERIRTYLTGTDTLSIGWRIGATFDEAAEERARLLQKREEATRELERLRRRRAELTEEEYEKREAEISRDRTAINRLIRSGIDDVPVIKFLTDKGILPNYAFPEEGVKLTSILSRRNDHARDEDGLLYLEYSRPASSALSEFAPGQFFYANGRQVEIERIEIGKEDLAAWTFCPSCSHVAGRIEGAESRACPRCGDEMWSDSGSHHEVVQLRSVISVDSEDKAVIRDLDQRDQRRFDRALMPFHEPGDITASWFTSRETGAPFGFEFIPRCSFRDFNFGPKTSASTGPKIAGERRPAQPFRICRHCGTLQKPPREDGDRGTHPPNCRASREQDLARDAWETEVFLMRRFSTEAIRIVIPVFGEADDDDLKSFVAAINLGMRRHFAGKVDHIRSTVFEAQLDGMTTVRSLYLYDSVPGGSGYLRQIGEHPETMRAVVLRAVEALRDCPCNQQPDRNGCYRCVKPYRAQFGPGEPDRDRARDLLESILQKWDSLSRTETGIDDSIRGALVESALEKQLLRALSEIYGEGALTPQVLSGGRRGFVLRAGRPGAPRLWTIEPQVQIDVRYRDFPKKRIDFLLTPIGRVGARPIVIEMDGVEYHAATVAKDLLDRLTMIRSGEVRVWTLAWKDLDANAAPPQNPLAEAVLGTDKIGRLGRVLAHTAFSPLADSVRAIQNDTALCALRRLLDGEIETVSASARSVLIRGLVATGKPLDQLPRAAALSGEGRGFLLTSGLTEHVGVGVLDLYLACKQISPTEWRETDADLRILLRAALPEPGKIPAAKATYTDAWRGLWRLVNLFQELRGFHVEIEGLDVLSPPDMTAPSDALDGGAEARAWAEARALCDEAFSPLIDALTSAETPAPDRFGDDLLAGGRVVGMIEFGWSRASIAVSEEGHGGTGWTLVIFDPKTDPVGETVTKILQALAGAYP
ncbi:DEAD/DEAH box helicase [Hyphomicrobium sp. 99]|uniref:DEAD/DEAH box helicase n=1 Tax=Hyphomicrobium sp. 99 TaxID=1163419 RepID=UPI0005F7909C|nr:DEAD/DEAH box helicase [Hyphomicrobium sp. 99]